MEDINETINTLSRKKAKRYNQIFVVLASTLWLLVAGISVILPIFYDELDNRFPNIFFEKNYYSLNGNINAKIACVASMIVYELLVFSIYKELIKISVEKGWIFQLNVLSD